MMKSWRPPVFRCPHCDGLIQLRFVLEKEPPTRFGRPKRIGTRLK